ncbi:hypothetical protein FRC17_002086 [Serendipita sp. 399]|nr:hypothetical protein FRC17_002086 [Serendipita sp. 399]
MSQTIYRSNYPDVVIPEQSIFTHVLPPPTSQIPDSLPAFTDAPTGITITRGELRDNALRFAAGLVGEHQVLASRGGPSFVRGDVISIYSPNCLSFALALYGAFAAGLKASPINSSYTPPEIVHQLTDCRAKAVVVHPALLPNLLKAYELLNVPETIARKRIIIGNWKEPGSPMAGFTQLEELLRVGKLEEEARFDGRYADETTLMCYSSGTTGLAKGVETTHKNLVAIMCMFPSVFTDIQPGVDKMLGFLPGYHIYGLVKVLLYPISKGGSAVLIRGFDVQLFGAAIGKYKANILPMVPPVILLLAKNPIFEKFDFSGYLNNATATLNSITPDGWFQTGDIAIIDEDGWYSIVDRKKELIKYKGFQGMSSSLLSRHRSMPPADLEAVLISHPEIVDSGVIGVYSKKHETELPRAYIVPKAGSKALSTRREREQFQEHVAKWITSKVAKHKYLRGGVIVIDAIPKSAAGKILRKELRERAKKELEQEASEHEKARL